MDASLTPFGRCGRINRGHTERRKVTQFFVYFFPQFPSAVLPLNYRERCASDNWCTEALVYLFFVYRRQYALMMPVAEMRCRVNTSAVSSDAECR